MHHPHRFFFLLFVALLDGTLGKIQDLIADCTDFRRCQCAKGVPTGLPAMPQVTNTKTGMKCLGVLINDRYVLSTTECSKGIDAHVINPEVLVTFKDNDEDFDVTRIFLHHQFIPESIPRLHDLMLVRLAVVVDMTVYLPICLPHASLLVYDGTPGWIMTDEVTPVSVKVHVSSCSFIRQVGGAVRTIRVRPGMFLCAGEVKTDFCCVHPGYALVMKVHGWYMLLGLSSTQELFPMCSYSQGLFSEVLPYRAWIRNITSDSSNCQFVI